MIDQSQDLGSQVPSSFIPMRAPSEGWIEG